MRSKYQKVLQIYKSHIAKVSVVIPAYNEEETIADVVNLAKRNKFVSEVIVINNNSSDNTRDKALEAGARVINCYSQGKGYAMEAGIKGARCDYIVFLDADISTYNKNVISKLVKPLLLGKADFIKSTFDRQAGRVTELVAKPLLSLLFPTAVKYSQPLSGMIAGKKKYLKRLKLEKDYGVDIGILLDMLLIGARVVEVNIGSIQNKMKDWADLPKMSKEVSKAILNRCININIQEGQMSENS